MHESDAERVADTKIEDRPEEMRNLPEDTHIVSGTLEGNGAVSLASDKAKLSAKVIKLERTVSGGINYQVAILVSEPTPAPVPVAVAAVDERREAAIAYFTDKKFTRVDAERQVDRFGVDRVLAMKSKQLDEELAKVAGN